jgi:hypothetical protein
LSVLRDDLAVPSFAHGAPGARPRFAQVRAVPCAKLGALPYQPPRCAECYVVGLGPAPPTCGAFGGCCTSSQTQVTSIERRNVLALIKTPITACVMLIKVSMTNSVLLKMPRYLTPAAPRAKSST